MNLSFGEPSVESVCVVTVTYGDRGIYLEQVLESVLKIREVQEIIVVDNNSESFNLVEKFNDKKINWIRMNDNTGSACGYHTGLKEAHLNSKCNYIWLLDDDNVPEDDALDILFEFKKNSSTITDTEMLAVQSRRPFFNSHQRSFSMSNPEKFFKRENSFLGFSIFKLFEKINFVLKGRVASGSKNNHESIKAPYTQYGGLLLNRKIIDKIGYPNKNYFLYVDDSEYTNRINNFGGVIYIVYDSIVNDIDLSWNYASKNVESKKSAKIIFPIIELGTDFRIYYSVRNDCNFEINNNIRNKFYYFFNKYTYLSMLFIVAIYKRKLSRFRLILRAISDGKNNKLGKVDIF